MEVKKPVCGRHQNLGKNFRRLCVVNGREKKKEFKAFRTTCMVAVDCLQSHRPVEGGGQFVRTLHR